MAATAVEVLVELKPPPQKLFDDSAGEGERANYLRFRLSPNSAVALAARIKHVGKEFVGDQRELFLLDEQPKEEMPYERLLSDAMTGDGALFTREDAVDAAWAVVDPVLGPPQSVYPYEPGSWGPKQADALIAADGNWHNPIPMKEKKMNATQQLHKLGQSIWLDNITRELLTSGILVRYISELSVTGLTSNPTIFDHAIRNGDFYDDAIHQKTLEGKSGEALFFELALEDLVQAADLFRPVYDSTGGIDGWVSLEVSPLLADDTAGTIKAAAQLHARAQRPNLFIKIPGTRAGIPAIEEAIFAGVPVNVTLLFSREHYITVAEAYMRGIERRIDAGLDPKINSVASIFVSRWDVAVKNKVKGESRNNRLGIAIASRTYEAYRDLLTSKRWQKLAALGAHPQRLLWASTGTKDPAASDTLYIEALAAPNTVNTVPEKTLLAFAEHGKIKSILPTNEDHTAKMEAVIAEYTSVGINDEVLAAELQREGTESFVKSWRDLMTCIAKKSDVLTRKISLGGE